MNSNAFKTKIAGAVGWIRQQPRAVLFPGALLVAIVVITALASLHGHDGASAPQVAAVVNPMPADTTRPDAAQTPARAASVPAVAPAPTTSLPAPAVSAKQPAAPVAITPPDGLQPGFVRVASLQQDQFDHWAQVSVQTGSAQSTSYTISADTHEKRIVWQAWIKLQAPVTLAVLDVGGEANGRVAADVDGASLGGGVEHFRNGRARQQVASLPLAAGWHLVRVTASLDPSGTPAPLATRVSFGDGTNPPQPVMPWAVPADADTPAPAASAEPESTNAAPAAASTTAQGAAS